MGIASAVFWIVIGVLYVLYQCFKERPAETLIGIGTMAIIFVVILMFGGLNKLISSIDPGLGHLAMIVIPAVCLYFLLKKKKADDQKIADELEKIRNQEKKNLANGRDQVL